MSLLSGLLDRGSRFPASCLIQTGADKRSLGLLANLVKQVEIATSRAEAWTGSIVFEDRRKEDGQWMVADAGVFARWVEVMVSADFTTHTEEVFRGYVKSLKPNFPNNGGDVTFEVELQDQSSLLDREHIRRIWGAEAPQSDRSILEALARPIGIKIAAQSGQGQQARTLNQDATAIRFLRERATANGYEFIFDQGEIYFGPPRLEGEPMPAITIYAGKSTNCIAFTVEDDALRPDQVRYDLAPAREGSEPETETVSTDLPTLGSTAAAAEGASLPAPYVWRMSREGDETLEETRARAQALVNEHSLRLKATGEVDGSLYGHVLKPGRLVSVDGAGARYGGLYYIDKVGHTFSTDGYKQAFEALRNGTGESSGAFGALGQAASALAGLFG